MIIPPPDDPRRPLCLALRSMWVLGAVYASLGGLLLLPTVFGDVGLQTFIGLALVATAVIFLLLARYARRGRWWAVVAGIAWSLVWGFAVGLALAVVVQRTGLIDLARGEPPISTMVALFLAAVVLMHVQVVWHLSNSFEGIRVPEVRYRGFDPLVEVALPRPVLPVEAVDDDAAAAR